MNLALKKQTPLDRIVVVDMAPVKVKLSADFAKYVIAMKEIQQANVQKQSEADTILKQCVPVSLMVHLFIYFSFVCEDFVMAQDNLIALKDLIATL